MCRTAETMNHSHSLLRTRASCERSLTRSKYVWSTQTTRLSTFDVACGSVQRALLSANSMSRGCVNSTYYGIALFRTLVYALTRRLESRALTTSVSHHAVRLLCGVDAWGCKKLWVYSASMVMSIACPDVRLTSLRSSKLAEK